MQSNDDATPNSRLILILSSERSGSTLTRVILGEHSRIVSPQELFLMRYPDYTSWRRQKSVAIESLVEYFRLLGRPKSSEEIDSVCAAMPTLEVYRWMMGFLPPGAFLLDKTPAYANDGETLRRSLGLSPFYIWLVRHPLGVIESHVRIKREARRAPGWSGLRRRLRDAVIQYGSAAHRGMTPLARQREVKWVVQQTIIREFLAGIADERKCTIRFEDLVAHPTSTVERLCRFLDIAVEPAMLEVCGERRTMNVNLGDPNFHKHDRIDPSTADGWRRAYDEGALTLETRRLMAALGIGLRTED
jgi:hypothetical protein